MAPGRAPTARSLARSLEKSARNQLHKPSEQEEREDRRSSIYSVEWRINAVNMKGVPHRSVMVFIGLMAAFGSAHDGIRGPGGGRGKDGSHSVVWSLG